MLIRIIQIACVLAASALLALTGCDKGSPPAQGSETSASKPEQAPDIQAAVPEADTQLTNILSAVVADNGLVHYEQFQDATLRNALHEAVDGYAQAVLPTDTDARKAMLCNAYNANVMAMIAVRQAEGPLQSVQDVPGFFDESKVKVGGAEMTLDQLHFELREFRDPRIHAVLVAGTRGSPPLRAAAFVPKNLNEQLDAQARRFVETKNRLTGHGVGISEIFKRYEEDFKVEPYGDALAFIKRHASTHSMIRDFMRSQPDFETTYLPYDWRLNQALIISQAPRESSP